MSPTRPPLLLALGLTVGMILAGGVAVATTTATQVQTCVQKKSGVIRVASKCKRSERSLLLGQTGPQGAPGSPGTPGSPGAPGTPGAAGPSNIYTYSFNNNATGGTPPPLNGTSTGTLLTLPAGSYLITWTLGVYDYSQTSGTYVSCLPSYVPSGQTALSNGLFGVGIPPGGTSNVSYGSGTLQDAITVSASTAVSIACNQAGGTLPLTTQNFGVSAIKTGSLTASGFTPHGARSATSVTGP